MYIYKNDDNYSGGTLHKHNKLLKKIEKKQKKNCFEALILLMTVLQKVKIFFLYFNFHSNICIFLCVLDWDRLNHKIFLNRNLDFIRPKLND